MSRLALQLYLVMMSKYSKFGVDTFHTLWVKAALKVLYDADDDDNDDDDDNLAIIVAKLFLRSRRANNNDYFVRSSVIFRCTYNGNMFIYTLPNV